MSPHLASPHLKPMLNFLLSVPFGQFAFPVTVVGLCVR